MRKRRKAQIVRAYLERASWRMLQEWRPIVARMIKGHAGIYALYKGEKLYYVQWRLLKPQADDACGLK